MPKANQMQPDGQQAAHVTHRFRGGGLAPGNPEADLEQAGRFDVAGLDQPPRQHQMAGLEHFEFGRHAGVADFHRHGFEMGRAC